ncbi:MAG: efflux RND transporter permease subunit, partial [Burkholderiaceae bacterium]
INTLTLLALVLSIGLVVADAIVVLENISHHIEQGMEPLKAATKGMQEISFAVVAMTLTLAAVFAPMAFSTGRTGRLFTEFALTLAGAVLVSGFVALTLSPMMCGRLLKPRPLQALEGQPAKSQTSFIGRWGDGFESWFAKLLVSYEAVLHRILNRRLAIGFVALAIIGLGVLLFNVIKKELSPAEDRGFLVSVFSAPEGSSIDYTARYALRIEEIFKQVPEADKFFVISGSPTVERGIAFFRPVDWDDRDRSTMEISQELQPKLLSIPGVNAFAVNPPALGQSVRSRPIQVVILSSAPVDELAEVTEKLRNRLSENPMLRGVDTDLQLNKPEFRLEIDRERAADMGVQVEAIGRTLESLLGGRQVTRFKRGNEQYEVVVQLEEQNRNTPQDIQAIYVRGRDGGLVPLSSLLKISESVSPRELNHFMQQRAVTITASLAPDITIGEALEFVEKT